MSGLDKDRPYDAALDERITRIASKIEAAAAVPGNLASFGASKHQFRLNPALGEKAVIDIERTHGVRLPDPYRHFITVLGDGGPGPAYGLLPLARAIEEVSDSYSGHLAATSPFEPGITYGDDWWDEFEDEEHHHDPCQGALAVVHHGCTSYTLLIVSGPARGRMVAIDFNGVPAPYVLEDIDFLAWYERWLDELAADYNVTRHSEKIPGGEGELLAIAVADSGRERRTRATWSLCALPALTASAQRTLTDLAADPIPEVREAALKIIRHHQVSAGHHAARVALDDNDPAVRTAAISALRSLAIPDLAAVARGLLHDPSEEVVTRAVWALKDSAKITVDDLAPLASSPYQHLRVTAIHHLRYATGTVTDPLLLAALADDEPAVRWTAVQAIEHLDLRRLQPRLAALLQTETDNTVLTNLRRAVPKLAEHQSRRRLFGRFSPP